MKNAYQKLSQKYTDEEIAESFIFPSNLSEEEQKEMHEEVRALRMNQRTAMTEQEKMYSALMQLKYQMTNSTEQEYSTENDFSSYLTRYMTIVQKNQKDLAQDIGMAANKLSEILSDAKEPDRGMLFRLENHSGGLIPALLWWKLIVKKQEHEIKQDKKKRREEYAKVKNSIHIPVAK